MSFEFKNALCCIYVVVAVALLNMPCYYKYELVEKQKEKDAKFKKIK